MSFSILNSSYKMSGYREGNTVNLCEPVVKGEFMHATEIRVALCSMVR